MFDLATAKTRLGIVGATQDVEIQAALDASLAIAEAYCKRQFTYAAEEAHYYHVEAGFLFVPRYPIEQVISVVRENGQSDVKYKVNKSSGFLDLHGRYSDEELSVTYAGGYKVLPDDLILALWGIFDVIWPVASGQGGGTVGGIESVSLTGVGTVRFGGGATSSGLGQTATAVSETISSGSMPNLSRNILQNYRRYLV